MSDRVFVEISTDCRTEFGDFYGGEKRSVTLEVAGMLRGNGWAKPSESVALKVDNSRLGVKSEVIK